MTTVSVRLTPGFIAAKCHVTIRRRPISAPPGSMMRPSPGTRAVMVKFLALRPPTFRMRTFNARRDPSRSVARDQLTTTQAMPFTPAGRFAAAGDRSTPLWRFPRRLAPAAPEPGPPPALSATPIPSSGDPDEPQSTTLALPLPVTLIALSARRRSASLSPGAPDGSWVFNRTSSLLSPAAAMLIEPGRRGRTFAVPAPLAFKVTESWRRTTGPLEVRAIDAFAGPWSDTRVTSSRQAFDGVETAIDAGSERPVAAVTRSDARRFTAGLVVGAAAVTAPVSFHAAT